MILLVSIVLTDAQFSQSDRISLPTAFARGAILLIELLLMCLLMGVMSSCLLYCTSVYCISSCL